MTPNSSLMATLSDDTIHPKSKFIQVKPTLQIRDERYPHIYAVGDVIEHTDVKTGHYAWNQSVAALQNIMNEITNGTLPVPYVSKDIPLIKLALGDVSMLLLDKTNHGQSIQTLIRFCRKRQ
jgi:NADH dehydrogenase FAD-containing subunit